MTKLRDPPAGATHMIVNTEWGGFAGASLPRLPADKAVDAQSVNPGWQTFEKLISGLYLGRIAVQVLLDADAEAEASPLGAELRQALLHANALPTPLLSRVENDRRACGTPWRSRVPTD